jgi:hypothetical protein
MKKIISIAFFSLFASASIAQLPTTKSRCLALDPGVCLLSGPTSICASGGETYFSLNCSSGSQTISRQFSTPGTFSVVHDYYRYSWIKEPDQPTGYCQEDRFSTNTITVTVAPSVSPDIQSSKSVICDGELDRSVTLFVPNPQAGVSYSWSSNVGGFSGTGQSLAVSNLAQSTTFTVTASKGGCSGSNNRSISLISTTMTPLINQTYYSYHKRLLQAEGTNFDGAHYWQISVIGKEISSPVSNPLYVTQAGDYYINRFNSGTNCWTISSSPVAIVNFSNDAPPIAEIVQIIDDAYNEIYFSNSDKAHILQYANYYWVGDASDNPVIISPYNETQSIVGDRIFQSGVYYLKGRDRETGKWGQTLTVDVNVLLNDDALNWTFVRSFDGIKDAYGDLSVVSESKNYFDQRGQALQSQTKTFHKQTTNETETEKPYVFASQPLKDKYDRTVGSTLSAPITQADFKYNSGFALAPGGKLFSYTDFDKAVPLQVNQKGTLGNYYSAQNQWNEPATPQAKRLFSRTDFYEDGTGEERKSAQPGDTHFIGSGKEVLKGTFPVGNDPANYELKDYLIKRAVVFGVLQPSIIEGVQTVVRDENERYVVSISDKSGKVLMTARKGAKEFKSSVSSDKMAYFYVLGGPTTTTQSVTITGTSDYVLENTITNTTVTKLTSALPHTYTLAAGFYRVLPSNGTVKVSYTNYFSDIAYQFYNDAGRLVSSVSPNGYEQWTKQVDPVPYADIDKSTHEYNHQGWLLAMTEKDAGKTQYKYRRDGKIRFSQNALQKENETANTLGKGRFSYTNYDDLGRPVESGEYIGSSLTFTALTSSLEFSTQVDYAPTEKIDWIKTYYDFPVALPTPSLPVEFVQTYVRGAVSCTENANTKTWYSYDELGRVVWMAQKPTNFPFTFVTKYEYDFLGNVLTTSTMARDANGWRDAFYHHYTYDKNKRLQKVYTSLDGTKKTLQAEYIYYLHGPLKRVVLATNLQGIDFVYNIHGWLTQINHPDDANSSNPSLTKDPGKDDPAINRIRKDVFGMILEYYEHAMTPGTYSSLDPNQFHKIPSLDVEKKMETAMLTDPISMYKASLRQSMEGLRNRNFNGGQ